MRRLRTVATSSTRAPAMLVLVALISSACSGDKVTQLIISVATDLAVPAQFDQLAFSARYRGAPDNAVDVAWDVDQNRPGAISLPARLAVAPGSTQLSRVVEYEVRALSGGKLVLSRRAALPFARDRQLLLRMNLLERCVPVRCQPDESCGEGGCEKVDKSPDELPDFSPDKEKALRDTGVYDSFGRERAPDLPPGDLPDAGDATRDSDGDVGPSPDTTRDAAGDVGDGQPPTDSTLDGSSGSDIFNTSGTRLVSNLSALVTAALGTGFKNFSLAIDPLGVPYVFVFDSTSGVTVYKLIANVWTVQSGAGLVAGNLQDGDATITSDGAMHLVYRAASGAPTYTYRAAPGGWKSPTPIPFNLGASPSYKNVRIAPVWNSGQIVVALATVESGQKTVYHITRTAGAQGSFAASLRLSGAQHVEGLALAANASYATSIGYSASSYQIHSRSVSGGPLQVVATSFGGGSKPAAVTLDPTNIFVYGFDSSGRLVENTFLLPNISGCNSALTLGNGIEGSLSAALLYGRPLVVWQTRLTPNQSVVTAWLNAASMYIEQVQGSAQGFTFGASRTRVVADSSRGRAFIVYEWLGGATPTLNSQRLVVAP